MTKKTLWLFVCVTTLLFNVPAFSQSEPNVRTIRDSIEFGTISSRIGICRMNHTGILLGLGNQDCVGQGRTALYRISGTPGSVINIQLVGSTQGNVRFTPTIGRNTTRTLNARGIRRIRVRGDLEITGPASGGFALSYTLSFNNE